MDETGDYKYMYMVCGAIVFLSSVWLLIGNAINYRLLAKEKKLEAKKKKMSKPESGESQPLSKSKRSVRSGRNPSEGETNV